MKKKIIFLLTAAMLLLTACANSQYETNETGNPDNMSTTTSENKEIDSADTSEITTIDYSMFSLDFESDVFDSVEEYYNSNQRSSVPDCYILKNPPEGAEIVRVDTIDNVYVTVTYQAPLADGLDEKNLDEYSKESMTEIICERFLFEDGENSFKLNVLDKIDSNSYKKIELNGKEYYYIPEWHTVSLTGESVLIGYQVEFLENGDYIFIHIPPYDSLENMMEYLEVIKAEG